MTTNDLRGKLLLLKRPEFVQNAADDLRKQFALPLGKPNLAPQVQQPRLWWRSSRNDYALELRVGQGL
jgi:hypothetical protein